jgi:uncharacterized protein
MAGEYHEPQEELSIEVRDMHRALASLIEELSAIDWYHQRASVTADADLKAVIEHNRDEEIEHAVMALEWIRRRFSQFDQVLRTYLFTTVPITTVEQAAGADGPGTGGMAPDLGSLNIGSMKKGGE